MTLERWFENAVVYCLDVETFQDSDGDGIGDFNGLADRLDYLAGLGVTCVWLMPFYPTPNRDNGYDIIDYYGVDARLGSPGDLVACMARAQERGIRVIVDLVVNHTSDQHPWFQAARRDAASRFRDYYVWSESEPANAEEEVVFPGVQESTWTYDEAAGAYYHHRFYEHQPDLNIANPAVREEILRVMGFWLAVGVSGFRIDAAPFLVELHGTGGEEGGDHLAYLSEMREFLAWRQGDAILLAEANLEMDQIAHYFGDGDRMHLIFNFTVNQQLFLGLVRGSAKPIVEALETTRPIPGASQWANFLRNHDELDLGRLPDADRNEVFAAIAPDEDMRLYGRGVRRRMAPILGNDPARLGMVHSLLMALPGTPVLRYGEEIGMGDDLSLEERMSIRTPMQWSRAPNGGFSTAPADRLVRPVIDQGDYAYERVNVDDQSRDPESLLNRIERLVRLRKETPEFGRGEWRVIDTGDGAVLAIAATLAGRTTVAIHNLTGEDRTLTLPTDLPGGSLRLLLGEGAGMPGQDHGPIALAPFAYGWFRVVV